MGCTIALMRMIADFPAPNPHRRQFRSPAAGMPDWRRRPRPRRPPHRWHWQLVGSARSWPWGEIHFVRGGDAILWPKSFEDHLVGVTLGLAPVVGAAHGPGEERQPEQL